jgi:hypothetical protein
MIVAEAKEHLPNKRSLSKAVTRAHAFGAQYAWFKPRVKGKSLERTCGICPIARKGPNDSRKTPITALARERKFLIWIWPESERQNERSK